MNMFEDIKSFDWRELNGKQLNIIVVENEEYLMVGGRDKNGIMYILHNSVGFCNIFSLKSQDFLVHFSNQHKKCTHRYVCGGYSVRHFDGFSSFVWFMAPVPPSTTA